MCNGEHYELNDRQELEHTIAKEMRSFAELGNHCVFFEFDVCRLSDHRDEACNVVLMGE